MLGISQERLKREKPVQQFRDRYEAGFILAQYLTEWAYKPQTAIVALPRGGVPVAAMVARTLNLPLDICMVRKLGRPDNPELAMGAIAADNITVWLPPATRKGITPEAIAKVKQRELEELARREHLYRNNRPQLDLGRYSIIIIDDGIATGATMLAAIASMRAKQTRSTQVSGAEIASPLTLSDSREIIVATPIAARSTLQELQQTCDRVVCAISPTCLRWVGAWYEYFAPVGDGEVCRLLAEFSVSS